MRDGKENQKSSSINILMSSSIKMSIDTKNMKLL